MRKLLRRWDGTLSDKKYSRSWVNTHKRTDFFFVEEELWRSQSVEDTFGEGDWRLLDDMASSGEGNDEESKASKKATKSFGESYNTMKSTLAVQDVLPNAGNATAGAPSSSYGSSASFSSGNWVRGEVHRTHACSEDEAAVVPPHFRVLARGTFAWRVPFARLDSLRW